MKNLKWRNGLVSGEGENWPPKVFLKENFKGRGLDENEKAKSILKDLLEGDLKETSVDLCVTPMEDNRIANLYYEIGESLGVEERVWEGGWMGESLYLGRFENEPYAAGYCDGFTIWYLPEGKVEVQISPKMDEIEKIWNETAEF